MHAVLILAPPVRIRLAAEVAATATAVLIAADRAVLVQEEWGRAERIPITLEAALVSMALPHRRNPLLTSAACEAALQIVVG
jgi:hypothetical protein